MSDRKYSIYSKTMSSIQLVQNTVQHNNNCSNFTSGLKPNIFVFFNF